MNFNILTVIVSTTIIFLLLSQQIFNKSLNIDGKMDEIAQVVGISGATFAVIGGVLGLVALVIAYGSKKKNS